MGPDTFRSWYVAYLLAETIFSYPRLPATSDNAAKPLDIDEIPDDDTHFEAAASGLSRGIGNLSIGGSNVAGNGDGPTPDLDDIPDMEEEGLEEAEDDAAAAPNLTSAKYRFFSKP